MNITFIADFKHMVYKHYLKNPKPMLDWKFNLLLYKNPNLVTLFDDSIHPMIRKYDPIYYNIDGEG